MAVIWLLTPMVFLCNMCKSTCSGLCKGIINRDETEILESLQQIILVLNKMAECNTINLESMKNINQLRNEAKQLLDEVNGYTPENVSVKDGCYNSSNIFIPLSIKQRVNILRKKFETIQNHVFDKSLTQLSDNTF